MTVIDPQIVQCTACERHQPITAHGKHAGRPSGIDNVCKECNRARSSSYRSRHRDKAYARVEAIRLKKNYGLTVDEYEAMFEAAVNCPICDCVLTPRSGRDKCSAVLDHDHDTDMARAVVCRRCNLGMGHADDSAERLRAMADYLDSHAPDASQ